MHNIRGLSLVLDLKETVMFPNTSKTVGSRMEKNMYGLDDNISIGFLF